VAPGHARPEHAEQHVTRSHAAVASRGRNLHRALERLLRRGRELELARRSRGDRRLELAGGNANRREASFLLDGEHVRELIAVETERLKLGAAGQSEQEMLRLDVVVAQRAGLFASADDRRARISGESLERHQRPPLKTPAA
jgi:hypothetical protein